MKKLSMASMIAGLFVLALCLVLPLSAYSADKLVVKDSGGSNTVFVVTDTGTVGSGIAAPLYNYDLSSQGVSKSSMHFSLNGTDVGGWLTSVADNNFFLSSGAMWNSSLGGWVQKSPDGKAVIAGSGAVGFQVFTATGGTVDALTSVVRRLLIDYSGQVTVGSLAGTYTNGSAYVCVNNAGRIFASESACP